MPFFLFSLETLLRTGLEIGNIVVRALNNAEKVFSVLIAAPSSCGRFSRRSMLLTLMVLSIWIVQTILPFTVLDARTLAIINGDRVPPAACNLIYLGREAIKLLMMMEPAYSQITDYKVHVLRSSFDE